MKRVIGTLEELEAEAASVLSRLSQKESGATLITLSGELGAGKTAFTKAFAKHLGITEHVTSPTFVLEKIYSVPEGKGWARLAHIDAYRLKDESELAALGFDELMSAPENLILLEWPENVKDALPKADLSMRIEPKEGGVRHITYA